MKKLNVCILIVCVIFTTACSQNFEKDKQQKETITNYYSENEIVLPKESKKFISILSVAEREDGNLEMVISTKKESGILYIYNREKELWKKKGRISDKFAEKDLIMNANYIGKEQYFVEYFEDNSDVLRYAVVSGEGEVRKIPLEIPSEFEDENITFTFFAYCEAGLICRTNNGDGRYYLLDIETGKILQNYNKRGTKTPGEAFILNDDLMVVSEDNIETINIESGEAMNTDDNIQAFLTSHIYSAYCVDKTNENIYRINSEGIDRYSIADHRKEDLMKNYTSIYSQEGVAMYGALLCSNNNIITYQVKENGIWSITEFVYLDKGKEVNKSTIKLYMLYQDEVADFLFSEFEQSHPESHIEVEYGIGKNNNSLTEEDAIKILNTEIASGNGPDIILVDNLPLDSYSKSNLLVDLSDIVDNAALSNQYFSNVLCAYESSGEIYSIPLAFELQGIQGEKSILEGSNSLNDFVKILDDLHTKEPDRMTLSRMMYNGTMETLFYTYFDSCFNERGELVKEKVGEFFENIQAVRNFGAYDISEVENPLTINDSLQYVPRTDMSISTQLLYTILSNSKISIGKINCAETLQMMQGLKEDKGIDWKLLKAGNSSKFIPRIKCSVLKESLHKEEAFEFIKYALNDGQMSIQKWNTVLPVKKDILAKTLQTEIKPMGIAFGEVKEEDMTEVRYNMFTNQEIESFFEEIDNCKLGGITDTTIYDLAIQSCTGYINHEVLLEDATNATVNKIRLRMEE